MQFIQAKRLNNKLRVKDNKPYAIDKVEFVEGGFVLHLKDVLGQRVYLAYNDLSWFKSDFNVVNSMSELEDYKRFGE